MLESDYIKVTNSTKLQIALNVLRDIEPVGNVTKEEISKITKAVFALKNKTYNACTSLNIEIDD